MNTEQVMAAVLEAIRQHVGDRSELLNALMEESGLWDEELEGLEKDGDDSDIE